MLSRFRLGLLMLVAAVAACGQKGPLFLPDDESSEVLPAEDLADEDVSEGG